MRQNTNENLCFSQCSMFVHIAIVRIFRDPLFILPLVVIPDLHWHAYFLITNTYQECSLVQRYYYSVAWSSYNSLCYSNLFEVCRWLGGELTAASVFFLSCLFVAGIYYRRDWDILFFSSFMLFSLYDALNFFFFLCISRI